MKQSWKCPDVVRTSSGRFKNLSNFLEFSWDGKRWYGKCFCVLKTKILWSKIVSWQIFANNVCKALKRKWNFWKSRNVRTSSGRFQTVTQGRPDVVRTTFQKLNRPNFEKSKIKIFLWKIWPWNFFYRKLQVIWHMSQERFVKKFFSGFSMKHFCWEVWQISKEL